MVGRMPCSGQRTLDSFLCPITQEVMRDPVVAADGHSYERTAITHWLHGLRRLTSPVTNLSLPSLALLPNYALKQAIDEYMHARPRAVSVEREPLPRDGLFAYRTIVRMRVFSQPNSRSIQPDSESIPFGSIVLGNRREYGDGENVFIRLHNRSRYIVDVDLETLAVETGLFVYQVKAAVDLRSCASHAKEHRTGYVRHAGHCISAGTRIQTPEGVSFVQLSGTTSWVFDVSRAKEPVLEAIPLETTTTSWVLEITNSAGITLRQWPDYHTSLRVTEDSDGTIPVGTFIRSTARVRGQHGDSFYHVDHNGVSGWAFASRKGTETMQLWMKAPEPLCEGPPGRSILVAAGDDEDDWVVVSERQREDGYPYQVVSCGNAASDSRLVRQIYNCHNKERLVTCIAMGSDNERWYCSGKKRDGTGAHCWFSGDIDREYISANSIVALGDTNGSVASYDLTARCTCYRRISDDLRQRLNSVTTVGALAMWGDVEYFVRDNRGTEWVTCNTYLGRELKHGKKSNGNICWVHAFESESWIVLRDHWFVDSKGIPDDLSRAVRTHYNTHVEKRNKRREMIQKYNAAVADW